MQRELTGRIPIRVRYDLKPEQKDRVTEIEVQPIRVLDAPGKTADSPRITPAAVSGEITVQKDRSLSVAARGDDLEPIDVRELTLLPQDGNLAYRYFKQPEKLADPFQLKLTATRHEIQEVVETVVAQALVEAVVTEDKTVTYRCRFRLKTSERQRLAVELPKDVEILDVMIAGKRVDLEKNAGAPAAKDRDAFTLNVARSTPSDEPFVIALVFRAPFKDNPLRGEGGNVQLVLPRLGGAAQQGRAAVAVQQLRVAVWVPKEFSLVGTPTDFTPDQPTRIDFGVGAVGYSASTANLESWFSDASSGLFTFTPAGRAFVYSRLGTSDAIDVAYWRVSWFTWWISGTLVVIAIVLSRTSWENRLTIVLLAAFGFTMYALKDADQTLNILAAARWGIVVMLAYWFIHALNRPRQPDAVLVTSTPAPPESPPAENPGGQV
jgi:hypothetical protein